MPFDYQLIRSKRRNSLGLQIKQGQLLVRAPEFLSVVDIERFLQQKSAWLQAKLSEQQNQLAQQLPLFTPNSQVWHLGSRKMLHIQSGKKSATQVTADHVLLTLSERQYIHIHTEVQHRQAVKKQLAKYYLHLAEQLIPARISELSKQLQLFATGVRIRHYKSRWGSCDNRGQLSFNYLLMMLPEWVIDYVLIHELCHLVHLNHSSPFWALVSKYCPNYQQAKLWLRQHQNTLHWQ
jgi:predicted metal-dependent hydrolase